MNTCNLEQLGSVWTNATEILTHVPLEPAEAEVVLYPHLPEIADLKKQFIPLPSIFHTHIIFALTAFDPPGQSLTLEDNTLKNLELWEDLQVLSPSPSMIFPSYGVHLSEGWREDGFCVGFTPEHVHEGRAAIIALATKYQQGAIFEYQQLSLDNSPDPENYKIERYTVPAAAGDEVKGVMTLIRLEDKPILNNDEHKVTQNRAWAGPENVAWPWIPPSHND